MIMYLVFVDGPADGVERPWNSDGGQPPNEIEVWGCAYARGPYLVTMDTYLYMLPENLPPTLHLQGGWRSCVRCEVKWRGTDPVCWSCGQDTSTQ